MSLRLYTYAFRHAWQCKPQEAPSMLACVPAYASCVGAHTYHHASHCQMAHWSVGAQARPRRDMHRVARESRDATHYHRRSVPRTHFEDGACTRGRASDIERHVSPRRGVVYVGVSRQDYCITKLLRAHRRGQSHGHGSGQYLSQSAFAFH